MSTAAFATSYTQNFDTLLYRVRSGDSLSKILYRYHAGLNDEQLSLLIQQVQADNPSIINPDLIKPDQLIRLKIPQQYCAAPRPNHHLLTVRTDNQYWVPELERTWNRSTREERDLMSTLLPALIGLGSAKMSMIDTTFSTNAPLMREMVTNHENYKAGEKTKGQYDYQRRKLVAQLTTNLGPTNLILNGTQRPTEVLRISRSKGIAPTAPIETEFRRMQRAARIAKSGGVLLTGVSLGVACHQIANASTQRQKNDILVESAGGLVGGILYAIGTSVALVLIASPVGWVGGLAIGLGAAVTGYATGQGVLKLYDATGAKIDFAKQSGIGALCSSARKAGFVPSFSSSTLSVL
ncbi:LysM peptidoglycan-binding domain-containing protein [Marinobacter sp. 1-4A]|uniref:LysM peptidoglycan-binding domain-containing protein n=1 Tax=Marinobacter sp. 1-4A TaxID=2582919 RepID=UPI00190858F0|nr:LysM domain-containing protein [Marinobacter sp. 1-4A]MBK1851616.1 LysM peptidoglycan-binding domain-containing protein [Marinobacter sp. 1-4A]